MDGTKGSPDVSLMTLTLPCSLMATTENVVPRSTPTTAIVIDDTGQKKGGLSALNRHRSL